MHKTGNVLNYLPKSVQPKAKQAMHEICVAETREDAAAADLDLDGGLDVVFADENDL